MISQAESFRQQTMQQQAVMAHERDAEVAFLLLLADSNGSAVADACDERSEPPGERHRD